MSRKLSKSESAYIQALLKGREVLEGAFYRHEIKEVESRVSKLRNMGYDPYIEHVVDVVAIGNGVKEVEMLRIVL